MRHWAKRRQNGRTQWKLRPVPGGTAQLSSFAAGHQFIPVWCDCRLRPEYKRLLNGYTITIGARLSPAPGRGMFRSLDRVPRAAVRAMAQTGAIDPGPRGRWVFGPAAHLRCELPARSRGSGGRRRRKPNRNTPIDVAPRSRCHSPASRKIRGEYSRQRNVEMRHKIRIVPVISADLLQRVGVALPPSEVLLEP